MVSLSLGLREPKYKILGKDVVGQVEAVGANVKQFKPGDEVFGDISACGWGAYAEYVAVPEKVLPRSTWPFLSKLWVITRFWLSSLS